MLVPEVHFVNAVTWGGAMFQFANITGPGAGRSAVYLSAGAFCVGSRLEGAGIVYVFTLCTLVWFLVAGFLDGDPAGTCMEHRATLAEGACWRDFNMCGESQLLLGSFSLDLFVVLLGGATALMPIFAHDILHQGPRGLGMLRAAPAAGAVAMSLVMARFPMRRGARAMAVYLRVDLRRGHDCVRIVAHRCGCRWLSLAVAGAADTISVIIRGSLLQLATPPEMRGRVSAVNSLFIGASNELGEFESGLTAQWWGAVRATVIGGIGLAGRGWDCGPRCFPACARPMS